MQPDQGHLAPLLDMLAYARDAVAATSGSSPDAFRTDKNLRLATERRIEIIGEAARKVSKAFQQAHPQIPWRKIMAQRHVLAHDYGEIDHGLVWRVVTVHLPVLIEQLEALIPPQQ